MMSFPVVSLLTLILTAAIFQTTAGDDMINKGWIRPALDLTRGYAAPLQAPKVIRRTVLPGPTSRSANYPGGLRHNGRVLVF